jgi:hypothetical protein
MSGRSQVRVQAPEPEYAELSFSGEFTELGLLLPPKVNRKPKGKPKKRTAEWYEQPRTYIGISAALAIVVCVVFLSAYLSTPLTGRESPTFPTGGSASVASGGEASGGLSTSSGAPAASLDEPSVVTYQNRIPRALRSAPPPARRSTFDRWREHVHQVRQSPELQTYIVLEQRPSEGILRNAAAAGPPATVKLYSCSIDPGRFGQNYAITLNGPRVGSYAELSSSAPGVFDLRGAATFALWFKVSSWTTTHQALLTRGDDAWRIQRYFSTSAVAFHGRSRGEIVELNGETDTLDGQWHCVVVAIDVRDGMRVGRLYFDGRLEGELEFPELDSSGAPVWIGGNSSYSGGHHSRSFHGQIDEVAIWQRAISEAEAVEFYEAGVP